MLHSRLSGSSEVGHSRCFSAAARGPLPPERNILPTTWRSPAWSPHRGRRAGDVRAWRELRLMDQCGRFSFGPRQAREQLCAGPL